VLEETAVVVGELGRVAPVQVHRPDHAPLHLRLARLEAAHPFREIGEEAGGVGLESFDAAVAVE
jgi:hypothetical protein